MKNCKKIVPILLILLSTKLYSSNGGEIIVGYSSIQTTGPDQIDHGWFYTNAYNNNKSGILVGFSLPIKKSAIKIDLDSRMTYHTHIKRDQNKLITFYSGLGISKSIDISKSTIEPKIGIGLEIISYFNAYYESISSNISITYYFSKKSPVGIIIGYDYPTVSNNDMTKIKNRIFFGINIKY